MPDMIEFTENNIQRLFGHEAAEDEDPHRLQEYYFKSSIYEQIVTDLPLRILVGHKGIGKSALLKVAIAEDNDKGNVAILIQPNDIIDLGLDTSDFLHTIRSWTVGLSKIIIEKVLLSFGIIETQVSILIENYRGRIINYLTEILTVIDKSEYDLSKEESILKFLDSPKISIYIDDLDRGWQGRKKDIIRISALFNAVRDLNNNNRGLNFRIALRSDVYYLVRTSDESTDKIEGSVVWHTWTNHEIFVLLIKRIETFFNRNVDEKELLQTHQSALAARYLLPIMEYRFTGRGHWENAPMYRVLMSLIRKRPRDLVKLCTLAARKAYIRRSSTISTEDFKSIFEEYSQGRIQDTINEFRSELPMIEKLVMNMKPNKVERRAKAGYVYNTANLLSKINNICESNVFTFKDGKSANNKELAAFLYKINFLTARKENPNGIVRKYFEENRYLNPNLTEFGFDWEIHPAYRWALQPDSIEDIYDSLKLNIEDE